MPAEPYVCVIDDDDAMRDSLSFLLDTAGITSRCYESAVDYLATPPEHAPACIVTDVRMPGMTGTELLKELHERGSSVPVVVITGHGDVALAVEAMKLGAVDFIEKPFEDEALLAAIRSALESHASSEEIDAEKARAAERIASLSARERQVLERLVKGSPNKTIAHDLGISPRTVEVYRANLMAKMQATSLSDLVRMALLADGLTG